MSIGKHCFIGLGLASLLACGKTEEAFLEVQFCMHDIQSSSELRSVMRDIARKERMTFLDRSSETEQELRGMGEDAAELQKSFPIINIGVQGSNGVGLTAGNLGLPPKQVAVGFTGRSDPAKARHLAQEVVKELNARWKVVRVPRGRGTMPLDC